MCTVDMLNNEQKAYCLNSPDFKQFAIDSINFCKDAEIFFKLVDKHLESKLYFDTILEEKLQDISQDIVSSTLVHNV